MADHRLLDTIFKRPSEIIGEISIDAFIRPATKSDSNPANRSLSTTRSNLLPRGKSPSKNHQQACNNKITLNRKIEFNDGFKISKSRPPNQLKRFETDDKIPARLHLCFDAAKTLKKDSVNSNSKKHDNSQFTAYLQSTFSKKFQRYLQTEEIRFRKINSPIIGQSSPVSKLEYSINGVPNKNTQVAPQTHTQTAILRPDLWARMRFDNQTNKCMVKGQ